jgi:hypothetical protein
MKIDERVSSIEAIILSQDGIYQDLITGIFGNKNIRSSGLSVFLLFRSNMDAQDDNPRCRQAGLDPAGGSINDLDFARLSLSLKIFLSTCMNSIQTSVFSFTSIIRRRILSALSNCLYQL